MSAKSIKSEGAKKPASAATNLIGKARRYSEQLIFATDILEQLEEARV
jgi:hypothetical protein